MKKQLFIFVILMALGALTLSACGGSSSSDNNDNYGDAQNGETLFVGTCGACHGKDAAGVSGLGSDLRNNTFVKGLSNDGLLAFVEKGRPVDDPANDTNVAMPPKGGNDSFTESDLKDIVAFVRSLQP